MKRIDIAVSSRIPVLMEMVTALTRATEPAEVLGGFITAMRKAYGPVCLATLSTRGLPPGKYRIIRFHDYEGIDRIPTTDFWTGNIALPVHEGGFLGEVIRMSAPQLFHDLDVRHDPVMGDDLAGFRSMIAIPLHLEGLPIQWSILFDKKSDGFGIDDLENVIIRSNLLAATCHSLLIAKQLRDASTWIQREVDLIANIQRSMLPQELPRIPGLRMAASYETYHLAGGDYYDAFALPDVHGGAASPSGGRWAFVIADASGHGPSAAVVTAMFHSLLHTCDPGWPPAQMLEYLNRHLLAKRIRQSFVTAFVATYDARTRELTYARAGHNPPVLRDFAGAGPVLRLDGAGGFPLGVIETVGAGNATVELSPGQTLVLYTDGVTEAMGPDGAMFGLEGIERTLMECNGEPECLVASLNQRLRRHQAGVRPDDDRTILAVGVEPA